MHLGQGIAHYLSAPLFLAFVAFGSLAPAHGTGEAGASHLLWALVLTLMFAPRLLSLGAVLASRTQTRGFGGVRGLLASLLLDQVFSLLAGPVSIVFYTVFVLTTLAGRVVRWDAQPRDDRGVAWAEAWQRLGPTLAVAACAGSALLVTAPVAAATLLPGLLLGLPLAVWSGRRGVGEWARRHGLFVTPDEVSPPAICDGAGRGGTFAADPGGRGGDARLAGRHGPAGGHPAHPPLRRCAERRAVALAGAPRCRVTAPRAGFTRR